MIRKKIGFILNSILFKYIITKKSPENGEWEFSMVYLRPTRPMVIIIVCDIRVCVNDKVTVKYLKLVKLVSKSISRSLYFSI